MERGLGFRCGGVRQHLRGVVWQSAVVGGSKGLPEGIDEPCGFEEKEVGGAPAVGTDGDARVEDVVDRGFLRENAVASHGNALNAG